MLLLIPLAAAQELPPDIETEILDICWPSAEDIYDIRWPKPTEVAPLTPLTSHRSDYGLLTILLRLSFDAEIRESVWLLAETGEE